MVMKRKVVLLNPVHYEKDSREEEEEEEDLFIISITPPINPVCN